MPSDLFHLSSSGSGAAAPTITLKKGTGLGNFTTTSATYVDIDATNLALTVTVPVGQKILISADANFVTTGGAFGFLAIRDGATVLVEQEHANASRTPITLVYAFTGDGASHTFKLSAHADGAQTETVFNDTATHLPVMTFWMGVAN